MITSSIQSIIAKVISKYFQYFQTFPISTFRLPTFGIQEIHQPIIGENLNNRNNIIGRKIIREICQGSSKNILKTESVPKVRHGNLFEIVKRNEIIETGATTTTSN